MKQTLILFKIWDIKIIGLYKEVYLYSIKKYYIFNRLIIYLTSQSLNFFMSTIQKKTENF